jgi:hypothetical protein
MFLIYFNFNLNRSHYMPDYGYRNLDEILDIQGDETIRDEIHETELPLLEHARQVHAGPSPYV